MDLDVVPERFLDSLESQVDRSKQTKSTGALMHVVVRRLKRR